MTIAEGYTPLHLWIDGQKLSGGGRASSFGVNPSPGEGRVDGRGRWGGTRDGRAQVVGEPVGAVAAFAPWNLPLFLTGRKIATALGAACSVIIKPAEETPASCLLLAQAFADAGLPAG